MNQTNGHNVRRALQQYPSLSSRWHWFSLAFLLSLCTKTFFIHFTRDAALGWDEHIYLQHANALFTFWSTLNFDDFYEQYFRYLQDGVRFFPPGSPLGYSFFSLTSGNTLLGARFYNALMLSVGIAASTGIFWHLSRNRFLTSALLAALTLSPTHNAYTLFLWTEGAQYGIFALILFLGLFDNIDRRKAWIIGLLLACANMTHGSSVFFSLPLLTYLLACSVVGPISNKMAAMVRLMLPSLSAILVWGLITLPALGEFAVLTSESIPMKSLKNPPSSYNDTWQAIYERARRDNLSLSAASSQIAWEYLARKGVHFFVVRGSVTSKEALVADSFPKRHFDHAKWPFLSNKVFYFLNVVQSVFYFLVYMGFSLFVFQKVENRIALLMGSIFVIKVASVFFYAVPSTRYFTSLFMIVFPFAFYGLVLVVKELRCKHRTSFVFHKLVWASLISLVTIQP